MLRFYSTHIEGNVIQLDENDSRHAIKSLRLSAGDKVEVVDGKGTLYSTVIQQANAKRCICEVTNRSVESPLPYSLHMAVAPTKNIDRFEWFLEKATEMGVTEITPILCQNSERKVVKLERMQRILVSAMKQSLKATLPIINELTAYGDLVTKTQSSNRLIAYVSKENTASLQDIDIKQPTIIFIGPEGDFSENEIELALANDFKALSLGPSRLRTETAAVFSVASIYHESLKM
jgi:16S rRNA (uracil1498-N3)-methyltransferase